MATVETGVLIDNTHGVYTPEDLLQKLGDFAAEIGASVPQGTLDAYLEDETPEEVGTHFQILYDFEIEFIEGINDVLLREHGLVLTCGEVEPGLYLVEEDLS